MLEMSLMEMVLWTVGALISMALLSCIGCVCMKFSDFRMKCYLMELARKKGLQVDLDDLHSKNNSKAPNSNDNCIIMIPESMYSLPF